MKDIMQELTDTIISEYTKEINNRLFNMLTPYIVYNILKRAYNQNINVDPESLYKILDVVPWNEVNIWVNK